MTLLDFEEERGDLPLDPSDLDFRIWLAWHDDPARFYVAFVASDDVYINTHDYSGDGFHDLMFENDMMMLTIDGDHSGGAGFAGTPDDWLNHRGNAQHYEAIASTVSGPTLDDPRTRNSIEEISLDRASALWRQWRRRGRRSTHDQCDRVVRDPI